MDGDLKMYVKKCIDCGTNTIVVDSRERPDGAIFRWRRCPKCDYRFRTIEVEECMSEYSELIEEIKTLKKENDRLKKNMRFIKRDLEIILKEVNNDN